ncbi:hypothetical protein JYK22_37500, partial [Nonomuraea sp. RK-328]|nr:hypothetical protein [Nonomuraea sp. RK-328]
MRLARGRLRRRGASRNVVRTARGSGRPGPRGAGRAATFGVLPYFLTELLQSIHGYSALQTGPAFLIPSPAIAAGTQSGERDAAAMVTGLLITLTLPRPTRETARRRSGPEDDATAQRLI